jgi:hypothetical protein
VNVYSRKLLRNAPESWVRLQTMKGSRSILTPGDLDIPLEDRGRKPNKHLLYALVPGDNGSVSLTLFHRKSIDLSRDLALQLSKALADHAQKSSAQ